MAIDEKSSREELLATIESLQKELHKQQQKHEDAMRQLAATFDCAPTMFILLSAERRVKQCNKAMADFLGLETDDVLNRRFGDLMGCPHFIAEPQCGLSDNCRLCDVRSAVEKTISTRVGISQLDVPFKRIIDGQLKERRLLLSTVPLVIEGQEHVIVSMEDLTAVRKIEEEVERTRRMQSIGTLAGGIAHDFNNILTSILGNVALAKMRTSLGDDMGEIVEAIEGEALRAADLSNRLLTFSEGGAPVREHITVPELILDAVDTTLGHSPISLEIGTFEKTWPISGSPEQLSTALSNVLINAAEAMGDKGTITVSAENEELEDGELPPLHTGRYVRVTVADNGPGIPPQEVDKVINPFHTTKEGSHGLGLTAAYSILLRHEGHLQLSSSESGTTVEFYLPATVPRSDELTKEASEASIEVAKKANAPAPTEFEELPEGTMGRVLLMDDEEPLRMATGEMLRFLGWYVGEAADGEEAIAEYQKAQAEGKPYDVVIMDLTIPGGMGGREAIKRLVDIDPEIRAIVSSGYHNDPIMANFWEFGFSGCMPKPYSLTKLEETVRAVAGADDK